MTTTTRDLNAPDGLVAQHKGKPPKIVRQPKAPKAGKK